MNGLLIDANLLVLLVVGICDRQLIGGHKRTRVFTATDYDLLVHLIAGFSRVVTTPHILAETSNLLGQTDRQKRSLLLQQLANVIENVEERPVAAREVVADPIFTRLGITDCGVLGCLAHGMTLLTADLDLYIAASNRGYRAWNFNHLREQDLLS